MKKLTTFLTTLLILLAENVFCQTAIINTSKDIAYPMSQTARAGDCLGPQMHNLNCSFIVSDIVANGQGIGTCNLTLKSISFSYGGDFYYLSSDGGGQKKAIPSAQLQLNGLELNRNLSITYSLNGTFEGVTPFNLTQGNSIQLSFLPKKAEALKNNPSILSVSINLGMGFTWSNISNYCGQLKSIINKQQQTTANTSTDGAKKAEVNGSTKNSSSANNSSEANKTQSSNSSSSSGSNSSNNNYEQQIYKQTQENNKTIQQNTTKLNEQVTKFANDLGNSVNEKRHLESEQATAEMARRQAEWERQIDAQSKLDREDMRIRNEAYRQSGFYKTDKQFEELEADKQQWTDWIAAFKDGGKVALQQFVNKYPETSFGRKAYSLFIHYWELLESGTGKFIPDNIYTAAKYSNWNLTKALLKKGVKATTYFKDTLGFYHSPIQQLYAPRYETGEKLKYVENDRDDLFRQLVTNGADPNMPWQAKIYGGTVNGYNYVIDLIVGNDYNGQNLEWLLQNKKLTQKTIQYMFLKLAQLDADAFAKGVSEAYEKSCKLHGDLQHKTNAYDLFYIEMAKLVKYGAPLSGTYPHPDYSDKKICLTPLYDYIAQGIFYPRLYAIWLNIGDVNSYINFQSEIINRANEVDKIYLYKLAQTCIESHGKHTDALGNNYDFKPLLKRIIHVGISPTTKEIQWKNNYYSMISYAKEKNPGLVEFLKDKNNFK